MIRFFTAFALAFFVVAGIVPAAAQFPDQATAITSAAGAANAQTGTISNATSYADVLHVRLTFTPAATNTGAATLTLNGFGTSPAFRKGNASGLTALTGGELVTGVPIMVMYDGTYFVLMGPVTLPVNSSNYTASGLSFDSVLNIKINGGVAVNALTISLQTNAGATPSTASQIVVPFRNGTIGSGEAVFAAVQGALSITIASGNTMGCTSAAVCRLWIVMSYNAGTLSLCAINAASSTQVFGLNEGILWSSDAGSITGGSTAGVLYCSVSNIINQPIRILGYMELTETVAGTWAAAPTFIQLMGHGIKKPGDIVQAKYKATGSTTNCNSATFTVATAVTNTITPSSAANLIRVTTMNNATSGIGGTTVFQVSRGTAPTLIGRPGGSGGAAGAAVQGVVVLDVLDQPFSASSVTYGTYCLFTSTSFTDGGGTIMLEEIMGALDPANDNGAPLSDVG